MKHTFFHDMNRILAIGIISFLIVLIVAPFPIAAAIYSEDGTKLDESDLQVILGDPVLSYDTPQVLFFYDPDCGACSPVHEYLDAYLEDNPDVVIEYINLEDGPDQMSQFKEITEIFNQEKLFIPLVCIGPVALEGPDDVLIHFESVYSWYMNGETERL